MPELVAPVVPAGRLNGQPQPRITVDKLVLRPWEPGDATAVLEAYEDPVIRRWHVRSMTEAEALSWVRSWSKKWAAETGASWAIEERGVLLGRMGVNDLDLRAGRGEAAYWMLPAARGRGVAPRALSALTSWMFTEVGLQRIELAHSIRNEASCRVAHKAGFALEGTKRAEVLHADGWHDVHLHARVREGAVQS